MFRTKVRKYLIITNHGLKPVVSPHIIKSGFSRESTRISFICPTDISDYQLLLRFQYFLLYLLDYAGLERILYEIPLQIPRQLY